MVYDVKNNQSLNCYRLVCVASLCLLFLLHHYPHDRTQNVKTKSPCLVTRAVNKPLAKFLPSLSH